MDFSYDRSVSMPRISGSDVKFTLLAGRGSLSSFSSLFLVFFDLSSTPIPPVWPLATFFREWELSRWMYMMGIRSTTFQ